MSDIAMVLDANAVLAYGSGSLAVGKLISAAADKGRRVVVPGLCLAEAFRRIDSEGWVLLEVLESLPAVDITPVNTEDCRVMGGFARKLRSKHLAHAVIEATAFSALGDAVPIMTADRDLVARVLPKEWPIIDL
jgi:predicted nucleic acid-binding protein